MPTTNVWGTVKADVGEGYCPECEREGGNHYTNCPLYVPPQGANQCDCGAYWCTRDHDAEATWAAHGFVL